MKKLFVILIAIVASVTSIQAKSLIGQKFQWHYRDTVFQNPYIDKDEIRTSATGVKIRYMHGGFSDGTMFSFYFPVTKREYQGHFFQYFTPFPDKETFFTALKGDKEDMATFSVSHGAYFIETNEGGTIDFTHPEHQRESSISAYRANAACADFSRVVAQKIYGVKTRPYGYCYGGSGGAYRTTGAMENTNGVWDGATPFVLGSPNAIPNVFSVRMNALRVLHDKLPFIVDAMEVGGTGDAEKMLNAEERDIWRETCKMGFPKHSWYGFRYMDLHGYVATYSPVTQMLSQYFDHDFWETPGYEGHDANALLKSNRIQQVAVVKGFYGQKMCERLGVVPVIDDSNDGTADRATLNMGAREEKPRALVTDAVFPDVFFMVGDLIVKSGKAKGQVLQMHGVHDNLAILSTVCNKDIIDQIQVGDTVMVDNSRGLASLFFHRHMVPDTTYYAWDQYRDANGNPIPPQQPMLIGPIFTMAASGCIPTGKINGKMILVESLWDREAYPWNGDWYRNNIVREQGQEFCNRNFRLWYTDRGTHGVVDDETQVISYTPILQQALLDVSAWVEKGIEPSHTTSYNVVDTQVEIPEIATERGGIQPSVILTVDGKQRVETSIDKEVLVHVVADCPKGTGKIVRAELCLGKAYNFYEPGPKGNASVLEAPKADYNDIDLSNAQYSADGTHVEFDVPVKYSDVGTYFPTVRVSSSRNGKPETYSQVQNLGRVRVIVGLN